MTSDLKLNAEAKARLESACNAAMDAVSIDWTTLTTKNMMVTSASAGIVSDYKLPALFHRNVFVTNAVLDVSVAGSMQFVLSSLDAATLAGFMLLMPDDKVTIKRKTVELTGTDMDAYKEACNILCGAYGKGLRNFLQKDISIAQKDTSFLSSSQLHPEKFLPTAPFIIVQSLVNMSIFPQSTILQIFPMKTAEDLMNHMEIKDIFDREKPVEKGMILVIDQEKAVMNQIEPVAKQAGLGITHVMDITQALERIKSSAVSLAIIDATLVKPGGMNAIRELKAASATRQIPVIACCNKITATKEIVINALQSGANDFVMKPFDTGLLLPKIKKLTGQ